MPNNNVAIYLDFENLALSADAVYPTQNRPLQVQPIVDFAATKGNISIKKAYADWSKGVFAQYQSILMQQGFELVHLPETNAQGKNGSDVRLAIDIMENMELYPNIDTIFIGSGDSDFIPVIQRARMRSKDVVVIGFEHSVGRLVKINSAEFKSLEELLGKPEAESPSSDLLGNDNDDSDVKDLLTRYIKNRNSDEPITLTRFKQDLLRLDPTFSEKKLGFGSFKKFVLAFKNDFIEKIDKDEKNKALLWITFKEISVTKPTRRKNTKQRVTIFLEKGARFQKSTTKRKKMAKLLFDLMQEKKSLSMDQMNNELGEKTKKDRTITKLDIRKYINTLFAGRALKSTNKNTGGPLIHRPMTLRRTINNPEILDQIYISGISYLLKDKFPELDSEKIRGLLGLK